MRRVFFTISLSLIISTLTACNYSLQPSAEKIERFKLISTQEGKIIRLDSFNGEVSLIKDKDIVSLGRDSLVQLEVGKIYLLENGKHGKYIGDQKFDTHIDDLLNKYK